MCTSEKEATAALEARAVSKGYGAIKALSRVSFSVEKSTIFGLIGPDGGGKTTLIRAFVSLLTLDEGELYFQGRRVNKSADFVRSHVGYMPQRFSLYQDLSVEENLRFFGRLFGVERRDLEKRIQRLYEFSGLGSFTKRRAGALSGGMKQKLALSCMLVHAPEIIILDEPTFGVDPVSRNDFWAILTSLRDEGTTILVSTAYMDEAYLCDMVGLMFGGKLLAVDEPNRLKSYYEVPLYRAEGAKAHQIYRFLDESGLCDQCNLFGDGVHFTLKKAEDSKHIETLIQSTSYTVDNIVRIEPGIEDLFLLLMETKGSYT
ncbi:ABC transporter ATP-binding protein [Sediminispirochaeta smaragdinae]|uniref:ABC transporter related protein n=1 Tax=Sediminispirochaeta smaragdinae (strain DSM 11293 / JCM 15392 / SEBR 4228) TaxID=573413 RepID=E1R2H3_SEDSS|nr:ABC transporter ATP-binding protein [Sediminispirochaeta smaragdinae]ADK82533.1 ABC transporter related protein [Sediminispirochaeta smaragdinae DSM 11293]